MSYNGRVHFGLIGDYDAMADLDSFRLDLEDAVAEIVGESTDSDGRPQRISRAETRNGALSTK
jgi:hypothetical protein